MVESLLLFAGPLICEIREVFASHSVIIYRPRYVLGSDISQCDTPLSLKYEMNLDRTLICEVNEAGGNRALFLLIWLESAIPPDSRSFQFPNVLPRGTFWWSPSWSSSPGSTFNMNGNRLFPRLAVIAFISPFFFATAIPSYATFSCRLLTFWWFHSCLLFKPVSIAQLERFFLANCLG